MPPTYMPFLMMMMGMIAHCIVCLQKCEINVVFRIKKITRETRIRFTERFW